ncbi:ATP-binding cassette domain-containing protein [Kitasatospora sp. NPDC049258]|uniref:ATP-binding cassette domain-containing protein n=1 Tax=Kitasatospora sp. NPDC049258 TaxID=3155394 RepID=UPI0034384DF0
MFENLDLRVPAGGLLVAHGPGGSGRTSLLLALAGRMRPSGGAVQVGGHLLPGAAGRIQELVAVARAEPAVALDDSLRVGELEAERRWLDRRVTTRRVAEAYELLGLRPRPHELLRDLSPADGLLLAVALALAAHPAAVVVDDVGRGCPAADREQLWRALARARGTGCTVLAGALDAPEGLDPAPVLVPLPRRLRGHLPTAEPAVQGPGHAHDHDHDHRESA